MPNLRNLGLKKLDDKYRFSGSVRRPDYVLTSALMKGGLGALRVTLFQCKFLISF